MSYDLLSCTRQLVSVAFPLLTNATWLSWLLSQLCRTLLCCSTATDCPTSHKQSTLSRSKWALYFAPFLILPSPCTGTRREQGTRRPFSCHTTDFRLDHLSFDSPDYVVLLCRLFTLGRCLDGSWNFTSAVLLNTAAFILPLETTSRNSCSQQNIQIIQRIFFSLTVKSPSCFLAAHNGVFDFLPAIKPDRPFRQRSSCFWHLRYQAKFIICEEGGQSF